MDNNGQQPPKKVAISPNSKLMQGTSEKLVGTASVDRDTRGKAKKTPKMEAPYGEDYEAKKESYGSKTVLGRGGLKTERPSERSAIDAQRNDELRESRAAVAAVARGREVSATAPNQPRRLRSPSPTQAERLNQQRNDPQDRGSGRN